MSLPTGVSTTHSRVAEILPVPVGHELLSCLRRWAIPFEFDRETAQLLLDEGTEEDRAGIWQAFLKAIQSDTKLPITIAQPGRFAFSAYVRDALVEDWLITEEDRQIFSRLNERLAGHFEQRWQATLAREIDAEPSSDTSLPGDTLYLEQSLYHQFAADPEIAFERFEQLFGEYEWMNAAAVCDRLVTIARAYEDRLPAGRRFWLNYYKGKVYDVMARAPGADGRAALDHRADERRALVRLLADINQASFGGDERTELAATINVQLGNIALLDGRLADAAAHLEAASQGFAQIGSFPQEIAALNNLGLVLLQQRRLEDAVRHYDMLRQRLLAGHGDDSYSLAVASLNLGNAYAEVAARREVDAASFDEVEQLARKAADQFKQAFDEFEQSGFAYGQGLAAATLGRWFLLRGEYEEAIAFLRAALRFLPSDSEEHKEVEQWLNIAQQRQTTHPEPEEQVNLPELTDVQRLAMMYQFSRHVHHPHSLLAIEYEYQATWRELQTLAVAGTAQSESAAQLQQAVMLFNAGRFRESLARLEEAARLARREGNERTGLQALALAPSAWECLGDLPRSVEAATRLLARARQLGSADYEMRAGFRLANGLAIIDGRGRWPEFSAVLLEGLSAARQLGNPFYEVYHLLTLGDCAWKAGQMEQGYGWLQDALNRLGADVEQEHFFRTAIYQSLSGRMRKSGNYTEALRYAQIAVGEAQRTDNPFYLASAGLALAEADLARGEATAALQGVEKLLLQARERQWSGIEQQAEYLRSEAFLQLRLAESAHAAVSRSLMLARASKMREAEVRCLINLGQALAAQGRLDEARHTLSSARSLSQERNYADHFTQADALLQSITAHGATP